MASQHLRVKIRVPSPSQGDFWSVLADAIYLGASCGLILLSKPYHYPALVFVTLVLALMWGTDFAFRSRRSRRDLAEAFSCT